MNEEFCNDKEPTYFASEAYNEEFSERIVLKDQDHLFQQYPQNHTKKSPSLMMNVELLKDKESTSFDSKARNEEFSERIVLKDQDNLFQEYPQSDTKKSQSLTMNEEHFYNKESKSFVYNAGNGELSEHTVLKDEDHLFQQYPQSHTNMSPNLMMNEKLSNAKESLSFVSKACNEELSECIVLKDQDHVFQQCPESDTKKSPSLMMNEKHFYNKESKSFVSSAGNEELSEHTVLKDQDHLFQQYPQSHTKKSLSLIMNEELFNDKESTPFDSMACNNELSERNVLKDQYHLFQKYPQSHTKISPNLMMNEELSNDKESSSFVSDTCNEEFSENIVLKDQDHLFQHYLQNHTEERSGCHTKVGSRSRMKEKSYVCEICNKEFHKKSKLDFHFLIHTRPFICEVCKQRFSRNSHLKDHLRIHTKEKPYACDVCHKKFSKKQNFDIHLRVHTREKNYVCEICNRGFSQKSNLTTHFLTHTKQKDYVCETCNKGFTRKSQLDEHVRIHTNEKSFICGICSRAFTHRSALNMHFRIHTKEKPYSCEICNRAFTHKSSLNLHYQVHSKVKSFVCGICNKAFSHKMTLRKHHVRSHTNAEFTEHILLKDQYNPFEQYLQSHTKISHSLSMNEELRNKKESTSFDSEVCNEEFSEHIVLKDRDKFFQQYLQSHAENSLSLSMNEDRLSNKESTSFVPEVCNKEFSEHIVFKDQDNLFKQYLQSHIKNSPSMNEELLNNKESTSSVSELCNEEFSDHIVLKDQDNLFQQYLQSDTKNSPSLSINEELLNHREPTSFVSEVCN